MAHQAVFKVKWGFGQTRSALAAIPLAGVNVPD
jgi:hypothetical protein